MSKLAGDASSGNCAQRSPFKDKVVDRVTAEWTMALW